MQFRTLAATAVCAIALVFAGCGGPTVAVSPGISAAAARIHYAPSRWAPHAPVLPAALFVWYNDGPVLVSPKIYLIFWGFKRYGDPDKVQPLLENYTKNVGGSAHDNIYTQYYEISSGSKVYITNPHEQLGGVWSDDSAVPKSPTDSQIAAEAIASVAHFKYDPQGLYVVATPHAHSSVGFGPQWCSYHSFTAYNASENLAYANLPYTPDAGKTCGEGIIKPPADESATDEGVTIVAGHEYGEAITDPQPYTGWRGTDGEIGDDCAWHGMANDPFGKQSYTSQPMLSNATHSCVQKYK